MDIYGIVGWPVKHSLSPAMHNTAFKALGIDAKYEKFEVKPEDLEDFLLNRKDVAGFNVTIPHKVKAKQILEKKGASDPGFVNLCGAINTVRRDNDKLYYTNTDVPGFLTSLKEDLKFDPKDKNILLIGCGGAGRAVMAGLQESSSEIYAYDESEKAMESCKGFNKVKFISKQKIDRIIKGCHLLVNATPIGMKEGDSCPIDKNLLHKDLFVYDVVYNRETELVRAAEAPAVNGLGMLLYQGAHAFEFWTGKKAPVDVMREELKKAIK
ncbi:MAG: shikimate dehydrogenase [Candidatus Omnitrophica bacterium]|nr:shikimate dehydrogenase [Candidatus Omnitrophota bacterium]MBU4590605.1 shikimate dehydrogenase [Candidatus Omnitrophota bacterium]